MKLLFGSFITQGSGKIGGQVASKNHYGPFLKTRVTPSNPQTDSQVNVRANFKEIVQLWATLSDEQRKKWDNYALSIPQFDRFGHKHFLSGYGAFTKINATLAAINSALLLSPNENRKCVQISHFEVKFNKSFNRIDLFFNPAIQAGYFLKIEATPELKPTINYLKKYYRVIAILNNAIITPADMMARYSAIFGSTFTPGLKIHFRATLVNSANGMESNKWNASLIIPSSYTDNVDYSKVALSWVSKGQQAPATRILHLVGNSNNVVLAGTYTPANIFRSTNYGESFTLIRSIGGGGQVFSMLKVTESIFLATSLSDGHIWRSTDEGLNWTDLGVIYAGQTISGLILMSNGNIISGIGTTGRILISTNQGLNWTDLGVKFAGQTVAATCECEPGTILAATTPNAKVFKSIDYGMTWKDTGNVFNDTIANTIAYLGNNIVLCGTSTTGKLFRSTDSGDSWTLVRNADSNTSYYYARLLGDGLCIVGSSQSKGLVRSTDYGKTFTISGALSAQAQLYSNFYNQSGKVLLGTGQGGLILKSNYP